MKLLSELVASLDHYTSFGLLDRAVTSIENDSRHCHLDSLFVAIRGTTTDGHIYIDTAIANGARTIVCEKLPNILHEDCTYLQLHSARKACARLAHVFYDQPSQSLRIIGVTGTNGKTTITFLLKQMLEFFGEKIGLIGTTGNFIGQDYYPTNYTTPEAPELARLLSQMRDEDVTTVVMEVSSHSLSMDRVLGVHFSAAIFTNLTHDHLDYHGTMERYADAKKILFDSLSPASFAVVNFDSPYAEYLTAETNAHRVTVGHTAIAHHRISNEIITAGGSSFLLNDVPFSTPLVGRFNIDNCAASVVCLTCFGYTIDELQNASLIAHGAPGRMESYRLQNGATAIIDYAHTPDALENALQTCRELIENYGKLVVIFGCGGDRDSTKRAEMGRIAEQYADSIFLTNDNPRSESPESIILDISKGIHDLSKVYKIPDRAVTIGTAISSSRADDILLIAGKGHETYQIINTERRYCSDKDEVLKHIP